MTNPQIKVKIQRRPVLKLKVLPKFPANVTAASPILLDRTGGNYAFGLDVNAIPISTATQAAIDAKVTGPASVTDDLPAIFDGTTGKLIKSKTYAAFKALLGLVKGDVGLGSVDNTSDASKPVSTAQAAADAVVAANAANASNLSSGTVPVARLAGTASGLTAGNVTTNANLTGDVTSVGNATTLTNAPVIAKVLTGYVSGAGTVSATDSILSAIQKLNGNDATNANLTGDVTSVGNATTLTNAPVIAKVLTGYVSGAGTISATDSILSAIQKLNGNDATKANLAGGNTFTGQQILNATGNTQGSTLDMFTDDGGATVVSYCGTTYAGTFAGVGSGSLFHGRCVGGTKASPTQAKAGNMITGVGGYVYTGAAFSTSSPASMHYITAEDQTTSANGAYINWYTTPVGTPLASRVNSMALTPDGTLYINDGGTFDRTNTAQTKPVTGMKLVVAGTQTTNSIGVVSYGSAVTNGLRGLHAGGTPSVPTATPAGDQIFAFLAYGYTGAAWTPGATAACQFISAEASAFSVGNTGTKVVFGTTPVGSGTRSDWLTLNPSGGLGVGASSPDPGINSVAIAGGLATAPSTTKTANYTATVSDSSLIFNGAGSLTLTLLAAVTYPGRWLTIKNIAAQTVVSATSNVVPLAGGAAGTAILAATAGKWAMLQSDGTNWQIMAGN